MPQVMQRASVDAYGFDCGVCGAALSIPANERTTTCPYCAAPHVASAQTARDAENPRFVVPFRITRANAADAFRVWQRSQGIFHRPEIKTATVDRFHGVYAPAWLFNALVNVDYSASIGERYTTTETYTTTVNGKTVTRTRVVVRTEWRPLHGTCSFPVVDQLVSASRGVSNAELEYLEPYDMSDLRAYAAEYVAGWSAEVPSRTSAEVGPDRITEMNATALRVAGSIMPGDTYADLNVRWSTTRETDYVALVPLWILAVRLTDRDPPLRVLINGQTGKLLAKAPLSSLRITLAVMLFALIAAAIVLAVRS